MVITKQNHIYFCDSLILLLKRKKSQKANTPYMFSFYDMTDFFFIKRHQLVVIVICKNIFHSQIKIRELSSLCLQTLSMHL